MNSQNNNIASNNMVYTIYDMVKDRDVKFKNPYGRVAKALYKQHITSGLEPSMVIIPNDLTTTLSDGCSTTRSLRSAPLSMWLNCAGYTLRWQPFALVHGRRPPPPLPTGWRRFIRVAECSRR
eukprot:SAG22_NODE_363_length_11694_cov_40.815783_5_plen_123_part_00